jgi:hypothetical protein
MALSTIDLEGGSPLVSIGVFSLDCLFYAAPEVCDQPADITNVASV